MSQLPADQAITRFKANEERVDKFVNSTGYITSNGIVVEGLPGKVDQLIYNILSFNSRGAWVTATNYAIKDLVLVSGIYYVAVVAHTSGATFAGDASKWRVFQGVIAGDLAAVTGADGIGTQQDGTGAAPITVAAKLKRRIDSEDYFLAGETYQDLQLQRAANFALANGRKKIHLQSDHVLDGPVNIASNSNPLIVEGNGNLCMLHSTSAGLVVKGVRHKIKDIRFAQSNFTITPTAVTVTADATYTNTQHVKLIGLSGVSVYRGIHVYMPASDKVAYRCDVIDCEFSNFNLQKTWAGSFGVSFDGPVVGDAGGNDSKVIGGLYKGYENNIIVRNSAACSLIDVSNDLGANGILYDNGADLRVIGGYNEYNDNIIKAVNSPVNLYWDCSTIGNYTNFVDGTIAGDVVGFPIVGSFSGTGPAFFTTGFWKSSNSTGVVQASATNGVKLGGLSDIANATAIKGVFSATFTHSFGSVGAGAGVSSGSLSLPGCTESCSLEVTAIFGTLPSTAIVLTASPGNGVVTVFAQNISDSPITVNSLQLRVTAKKF